MKSLRNNARAEEILNLVLFKVFALKCFEVLVKLMKHCTGEILSFHGMIYYTPDQR